MKITTANEAKSQFPRMTVTSCDLWLRGMIPRSGLQKNHDLVLERCVLAAVRMNDRAFGCTTGPDILLTRHFLRCMRVQYEVTMAVLGSVPPNDYRFCRAASGWRTAQVARHLGLDVDPFSDTQRIFKFHAQVT
ncbi:MAG: hypothetical protein ACSHXH_02545, partial [Marivita sp.]|uniref:hypothetical protein n=1 Tax=Marivita sp. TaxID=2003365 RepID=UPI003EF1002A